MMSISSISTASPPLQSLPSSASNPGSGSTSSLGEQLLAEVAQAQAGSGSTTDPLLQTLVSLGSGSAASSAAASPLTYNAKGLLNQIQNSLMLNDPLLQTSDTSSNDSGGGTDASLLDSLLAPAQGSGAAAGNAATGAAPSTASPGPNVNWAQLLQKDPSLASAFAQSQMSQGILDMLP